MPLCIIDVVCVYVGDYFLTSFKENTDWPM